MIRADLYAGVLVPPLQVRLAVVAEPGAELYNGYHLLTQLVGLYAQAAQLDPHRKERALWHQHVEQGVEDLGELVLIWDRLAHQRSGALTNTNLALHAFVSRACRRTEIIVEQLNLWIPFQRWARLLGRIERAWCDFLVRLEPLVGEEEPLIRSLRERAAVRLQKVCGLYEKYAAERQQIDASFAAGVQWLANGGLSA